jgi:hypothetical protein
MRPCRGHEATHSSRTHSRRVVWSGPSAPDHLLDLVTHMADLIVEMDRQRVETVQHGAGSDPRVGEAIKRLQAVERLLEEPSAKTESANPLPARTVQSAGGGERGEWVAAGMGR